MNSTKGLKKERVGIVYSTSMQKTIIIKEEKRKKHPKYGKFIRTTKKYVAHDERNFSNVGDKVRIIECRPLSKMKRWKLLDVLEKAK